MNRITRALTGVTLLAVLVTGTACSSNHGSAAPHDSADVLFASDMIPHHEQAVAMADLALTGHGASEQVRTLATQIRAAQSPEIRTMAGWLTAWHEPVPSASASSAMGGMTMPGMMSAHDMTTLAAARGTAFDTQWLTMMISHHEGALTMARTEITDGRDSRAKALARSIVSSQRAQIATMKAALAR